MFLHFNLECNTLSNWIGTLQWEKPDVLHWFSVAERLSLECPLRELSNDGNLFACEVNEEKGQQLDFVRVWLKSKCPFGHNVLLPHALCGLRLFKRIRKPQRRIDKRLRVVYGDSMKKIHAHTFYLCAFARIVVGVARRGDEAKGLEAIFV